MFAHKTALAARGACLATQDAVTTAGYRTVFHTGKAAPFFREAIATENVRHDIFKHIRFGLFIFDRQAVQARHNIDLTERQIYNLLAKAQNGLARLTRSRRALDQRNTRRFVFAGGHDQIITDAW